MMWIISIILAACFQAVILYPILAAKVKRRCGDRGDGCDGFCMGAFLLSMVGVIVIPLMGLYKKVVKSSWYKSLCKWQRDRIKMYEDMEEKNN